MNYRLVLLAIATVCVNANDVAQKILSLSNEQRQAFGLPPFCLVQELNDASLKRSQELTSVGNLLSHDYKSDVATRAKSSGYQWNAIGENLASNQSPESAFSQLFNEPPGRDGHRQNILNPGFVHMGVGQDTNGVIVQMFGASTSARCLSEASQPVLQHNSNQTVTQSSGIPAVPSPVIANPYHQKHPAQSDYGTLTVIPVTTTPSQPVYSSVGIQKCKLRSAPGNSTTKVSPPQNTPIISGPALVVPVPVSYDASYQPNNYSSTKSDYVLKTPAPINQLSTAVKQSSAPCSTATNIAKVVPATPKPVVHTPSSSTSQATTITPKHVTSLQVQSSTPCTKNSGAQETSQPY